MNHKYLATIYNFASGKKCTNKTWCGKEVDSAAWFWRNVTCPECLKSRKPVMRLVFERR